MILCFTLEEAEAQVTCSGSCEARTRAPDPCAQPPGFSASVYVVRDEDNYCFAFRKVRDGESAGICPLAEERVHISSSCHGLIRWRILPPSGSAVRA